MLVAYPNIIGVCRGSLHVGSLMSTSQRSDRVPILTTEYGRVSIQFTAGNDTSGIDREVVDGGC